LNTFLIYRLHLSWFFKKGI